MIYNILWSDKSFGGAEIYVRKMKAQLGVEFIALKNSTFKEKLSLVKLLLNRKNQFIFHDARASLLSLMRFYLCKDICVLHGPGKHAKLNEFLFRFMACYLKKVVLVSESIFNHLFSNTFIVIENESSLMSQANYQSQDAVYFGRVEQSKNVDALCHFWSKTAGTGMLHLVGDGSLLNGLKSQYEASGRIIFYGAKTHREIEEIIPKCSFYISLSAREGKSLALQEAMSCGLLPIVTDIPSQHFLQAKYSLKLVDPDLKNASEVLAYFKNNSKSEKKTLGHKIKINNSQKAEGAWTHRWLALLNRSNC